MMDNIYEEYESMQEFKDKSFDGQPSLGKAVDNSIVYIMDENLQPQKVFKIYKDFYTNISIHRYS